MASTVTVQDLVNEGTVKTRYGKLESFKTSVLTRGRDCAKLTLPYLLTEDSHNQDTALATPYNSIGARAINNLASKLLLSLFPPQAPFFRLKPNTKLLQLAAEQGASHTDIEASLSLLEGAITDTINQNAYRTPLFEALKLLIGTGNCLVEETENGKLKIYNLNSYCVKRDFEGSPVEILIREYVDYNSLEDDVKSLLGTEPDNKEKIELYTRYYKADAKTWISYQEVAEVFVPQSEATLNITNKQLPILPLRWTSINNEDYGRGLVEQYIGSLRSLEALTQLMVEGTAIAAKVLFGIRPGSKITVRDLASKETGDIVLADLERDVTKLQVDKAMDFQVAYQLMNDLTQTIAHAFLLNQSAVRNSERTTAYEIRLMATELEDSLGGVYSILSQELQLPILKLVLGSLKVPANLGFEPVITTGLDALGRIHDVENINTALSMVGSYDPEALRQYLNYGKLMDRVFTSLGINPEGLIKSEEEIQQQQQAMAQQQLAMQAGINAVDATTKQGAVNGES